MLNDHNQPDCLFATLYIHLLVCWVILELLVGWWSSILDYQSLFMLNQALSSKYMKLIIGIDLIIKLQPFNCLFHLIWQNMKETALYHVPLRLGHRAAIFLQFPWYTASQTRLKYFDIFPFSTLISRFEINVFTLFWTNYYRTSVGL